MNEITQKIHNKVMFEFAPLAEQLISEGKTQYEVVSTCNDIIQGRIRDYYKLGKVEHIGNFIRKYIKDEKDADSKAENIFFGLLKTNDIDFKFQYPIDPYRVDFLLGDDLVVEIDGPQHIEKKDEKRDKYIQDMGYRILRIPIYILSQDPEMIIKEIKKLI
jgi:very-short-patch-repair endonuclease